MKIDDVVFGQRAKDPITGVLGTITGKADYHDGEPQALLEWGEQVGSCMKPRSKWFSVSRLESK